MFEPNIIQQSSDAAAKDWDRPMYSASEVRDLRGPRPLVRGPRLRVRGLIGPRPRVRGQTPLVRDPRPWGRFHEKSQTEPDSRLSQGLKSETFVSAEFLAQMDFTKGGSAETSLKLWSQLLNLISYI